MSPVYLGNLVNSQPKIELPDLIGSSKVMYELKQSLVQVAPSDAPIMITGKSGVGKENVARAIHKLSNRPRLDSFVPINCGAIPHELLENELFGHVKGAFSGAVSDYKGRFQQAHGGTLFLDEIGDMPPQLQVKLLRVVQDGRVSRLGSDREELVDVRIICATHRDLPRLVETGDFREDLFFRLNVIPIQVACLSDRVSDIQELFDLFATKFSHGKAPISISKACQSVLNNYSWPGNVRELEHFCRRLSVLYPAGQDIDLRLIPAQFIPSAMCSLIDELQVPLETDSQLRHDVALDPQLTLHEGGLSLPLLKQDPAGQISVYEKSLFIDDISSKGLKATLADIERDLISSVLCRVERNVSECARILGVKRTTLIAKLAKLDIR